MSSMMLKTDAPMKRVNKPPKVAMKSFISCVSERVIGMNVSSLNDTAKRLKVELK